MRGLQEKGACDKDFWIDVLLTILGWLPGYALLHYDHQSLQCKILLQFHLQRRHHSLASSTAHQMCLILSLASPSSLYTAIFILQCVELIRFLVQNHLRRLVSPSALLPPPWRWLLTRSLSPETVSLQRENVMPVLCFPDTCILTGAACQPL